jgi:hypothetical protein
LNVIGSLYAAPARGGSVLPAFTSGTLALTDGGALSLSGSTQLDKSVTLTPANVLQVTNPGADKTKATITNASGLFSGSFIYPGQTRTTSLQGVLFQNQGAAQAGGGFFLSPVVSGTGYGGNVDLKP